MLRVGAAALLAVALFSGGVAMASDSLPGAPLYSFKRAGELAQLTITGDSAARARLKLSFARRRFEEILALAQRGYEIESEMITDLESDYSAAAAALAQSSPDDQTRLRLAYGSQLAAEQAQLDQAMGSGPAFNWTRAAIARADTLVPGTQPTQVPTASLVPTLADTERPTATATVPAATATERYVPSQTPTSAPTSAPTRMPAVTQRPPTAAPPTAAPPTAAPPTAAPPEDDSEPSGSFSTTTPHPGTDATAKPSGDHPPDSDPGSPTSPTAGRPPRESETPKPTERSKPTDTSEPKPTEDSHHEAPKTPEPKPTEDSHHEAPKTPEPKESTTSDPTRTSKPPESPEPPEPPHS